MIGRREFITLLGGAAVWPRAARAQDGRTRRIGVMFGFSEDDPLASTAPLGGLHSIRCPISASSGADECRFIAGDGGNG